MRKKQSIVPGILLLLALVFAVLAVREYLPYWINEFQMEQMKREIRKSQREDSGKYSKESRRERTINWKKLHKINPDIIAWIEVPGTKIDYPVLKCKSWNEYLSRDYKGNKNILGSIFVQPETASDFSNQHTVIYGHNMKDKQMFGSLHNYESKKFWDKHRNVYIYLPDQTIQAEVYSTYDCMDMTETFYTEFPDEAAWQQWKDMTVEKSYYNMKMKPTSESRVLTLSTCSNGRGRSSRYVVHCMIQTAEEGRE